MTWDVLLGYFTGLRLLSSQLDPATLVRTALVVHLCDSIMCRLFAHNNGYPKNVWTALGFVFGIGGFYVRRPGLGVSGVLFWPLSMTWVPPAAYASAHEYNLREFRAKMMTLREEAARRPHSTDPNTALQRLDELRSQGRITDAEYQHARQELLEAKDGKSDGDH